MARRLTGILKKQHVKVTGSRTIGAAAPDPSQPQARIVQMNDDHAVLEVRCGCGRRTLIQCRWSGPAPDAGPAPEADGA